MLGPVTVIVLLSYHNKPLCREVKGLLGKQIAQGHMAWKLWSLNLDLDLLTLKSIFFLMYSSAPIVLCHAAPTFPVHGPLFFSMINLLELLILDMPFAFMFLC